MSQRPVTQSDLARVLGLGQRTISRAFDAPHKVAPATLERILAEAQRQGYQLNHGAMALRTGRHRQVALAQSTTSVLSYLPPALLGAIHDQLEAAGLALRLLRLPPDGSRQWEEVPQLAHRLGCDALLVNLDVGIPPALGELLRGQRLPAVFLNSRQPADCVHPDDHGAGAMATRALLDAGHTRIAYLDQRLGNLPDPHYSRADRLAGYRAAMATAGLPDLVFCPVEPLPDGAFTEVMIAWWRTHRPTAAVTYGGEEVGALMLAGTRLGVSLGKGLGLVTFADRPVVNGLPITTVVIDFHHVGVRAVEELLLRLDGGAGERPAIAIPPYLVPGDTSATPIPPRATP